MRSARTAGGATIGADGFASACAAIETIATNNSQLLALKLGSSKEDVCAVVELARAEFYRQVGKG